MKHRHLVHQELTPAAIEDILDRGRMPDWAPLIAAIRADPHGTIAETTLKLCGQPLYAAPVFRRVIANARNADQPPTGGSCHCDSSTATPSGPSKNTSFRA